MSTPTVKAIDKRSVHQICSGQVVVTLATAVKELVENSLDAGSTNIEVRLKNWGADSLEVVDNGSGVLPANFAALALKHHTSKLNVFADLVGVETFGFRGEALSSLCALGNLSITTCHKSQSIGARIEYDHDGQITKQQATARTHGTTVTLQNLFSTLPVRHKEFIRNIKREYTKMMQVLQGYCVISTGVRISCYTFGEKGKKSVALTTNGNSDMRENISNVFGPKQLQTLLEFKQINPTADDCEELGLESQLGSDPVFCLTGYVSRCDHGNGRNANDRQYIYINKRPCDMPKLTRLVNEVYHVFNRNQYPFLVLNIDLSKDLVDVNVTPDKRQVFLQQEKLLFATVKSSLKAMYDPGATSYDTNQKPFAQLKMPTFTKRKNEETNATSFSKSIKDRLMLAAKVSKNKEASSILKFTTKPSESVQELDISKVCKNGDAIVSTGFTEIAIDSGTLSAPKDELSEISKVSTFGEAVSLESTASIPETHEEAFRPQIENSVGASPIANGHLPLNPKEYDLSFMESYVQEGTADKPRETFEGPGQGDHAINCETFENSVDSLTEDGKCTENVIRDNVEQTGKLENNKEFGESARIENGFEVSVAENPYESKTVCESVNVNGKNSSDTSELKRRRSPENDGSEELCNAKKIRVDADYDELGRTSRKSIGVNFDLQKLRERFTAGDSSKKLEAEKSSGYSRTFRATIAPESNQKAEEELRKHITKEMFSKMEIIGQFNQGFITTKLGDDLFIIDQHASDEKYNFEDQQRNTVLKSQRLICPQSLDLTAVNENILMENLEVFRKNGFDFEIDENAPVSQRVKLMSLPVSRNWSFGKSDIEELIFMLGDSPGVNYRPSNIRKMFASRACRMSVMVGTALNDGQMRRIVGHMGEMDHPWNCPHGRPTMRHLINLNMVRK